MLTHDSIVLDLPIDEVGLEQGASHYPAPSTVHQPTQVSGQLLGFRAWQQHAVIQGMQKTLLGNPAVTLNQFLMHDGDLPGWPAKTDETQL